MVLLGGEDQVDSVMAEEKPLVLPLLSKRESQIMELFYSQTVSCFLLFLSSERVLFRALERGYADRHTFLGIRPPFEEL